MANTLAFQLYTLKEYEGGWDAAFEAVKSLGIDTIEIWSGAVPDAPDSTTSLEEMRASLKQADMKLRCGHISMAEFDNRYEAWRDLMQELAPATG